MQQAPSLFAELPDDIDETWRHGFIIGGMAYQTDALDIARAYVNAGDVLTEHPEDKGEPWEVAYPALFLYRHAIELYLKAIVKPQERNHDLTALIGEFVNHVGRQQSQIVPAWVRDNLMQLATLDPRATAFRYVDSKANQPIIDSDEKWVSFTQLRQVVGLLVAIFERVLEADRRH